jgi:hypothetical protein
MEDAIVVDAICASWRQGQQAPNDYPKEFLYGMSLEVVLGGDFPELCGAVSPTDNDELWVPQLFAAVKAPTAIAKAIEGGDPAFREFLAANPSVDLASTAILVQLAGSVHPLTVLLVINTIIKRAGVAAKAQLIDSLVALAQALRYQIASAPDKYGDSWKLTTVVAAIRELLLPNIEISDSGFYAPLEILHMRLENRWGPLLSFEARLLHMLYTKGNWLQIGSQLIITLREPPI